MRAFVLLAALMVSPASRAASPPVSLLGVSIGAPLSVELCTAATAPDATCANEDTSPGPLPNLGMRSFQIRYAVGARPTFAKYPTFIARVIDGNVEAISIFTNGPGSQSDVLRQLTEKFGDATSIEQKNVQNGFGASFPYADAHWQIGGVEVVFRGIFNDVKTGLITAVSAKAAAKYVEQGRARAAAEPKL